MCEEPLSPEDLLEDQRYDEQVEWIRTNLGQDAADGANYGWGVDGFTISTKVYGHGVLTMNIETGEHEFETFEERYGSTSGVGWPD